MSTEGQGAGQAAVAGAGRAAVVGAGIVGLSAAWFLQEHGYEVTVYDSRDVAAGASAGNAGWICPGMTAPLPEPGVLSYALRSLVRRDSPLRVTPTALPVTARFLAAFALNCTEARWNRGVAALAGICTLALSSYELLTRGGVEGELSAAPVVIAFGNPAEAAPVKHELQVIGDAARAHDAGQTNPAGRANGAGRPHGTHGAHGVSELNQDDLRSQRPVLSAQARHGLLLNGQGYVQPFDYTINLARSFQARGGQLKAGDADGHVERVQPAAAGKVAVIAAGTPTVFDIAVLANGAWLRRLGRRAGVRVPIAAGRGYSFTVKTAAPIAGPVYLPSLRVACTPAPGGMRMAGTMEFRPPEAPVDQHRVDAIIRSARNYLDGVDWASVRDVWVGPRPVTADGLPLIGATKHEHIYVAGGHGMWGMTLGPATGRLLAEFIATGTLPPELRPFDPRRSARAPASPPRP
jgi:D-amino-acid dehydrogenase